VPDTERIEPEDAEGSGWLVEVRDLSAVLPNGGVIVDQAVFTLRAGEIVSLLGPSGAGKSTLLNAVFSPDDLRAKGFTVQWSERRVGGDPALVPQRGALLDHLDVADNIALAQAGAGLRREVEPWLAAVDLEPALGDQGRSVAALSGGQAQRVAVARVLAAGRKIIVLDEPSVGLDPLGVRRLARLLIKQARDQQATIILITHDLSLAGGASDRILYLDPTRRALVQAVDQWSGPLELTSTEQRQQGLVHLEQSVEQLLQQGPAAHGAAKKRWRFDLDLLGPFRVAGEALVRFAMPRLFRQSLTVLRRGLTQSLLRPVLFYAIVGALLGFTVPYVMAHISEGLKPRAVLTLLGGTYVLTLAPPLSAIIFAATSGSAINAWLGGLRLHGQVVAVEGLGIQAGRYLWSPSWVALVAAYLVTALGFVAAMVLGGWVLFDAYEVPHALAKITSDFLDPPPSRVPYLIRALFLVAAYALGVASIVVSRGSAPKDRSDQVTAAMTSSVMRSTLLVVTLELVTIVLLFSTQTDR